MLIRKFCILVILSLSFTPVYAGNGKISYKQCVKLSNKINTTYPMTINRDAKIYSSYCSGLSGTPSLHYIYHTNFTELAAGEQKRLRAAYCSNKKTRTLLRILDNVYLHYFSPSGTEFAVINITEKHCK